MFDLLNRLAFPIFFKVGLKLKTVCGFKDSMIFIFSCLELTILLFGGLNVSAGGFYLFY
jgi:hypothetical protein